MCIAYSSFTDSPPSFCVAGVALMTLGWFWRRAWSPLAARDAAPLCVAGVALGDIHRRFTWQAYYLATSTFVLCGRSGTWRHPPSFCVAGVALGDIHFRVFFLCCSFHVCSIHVVKHLLCLHLFCLCLLSLRTTSSVLTLSWFFSHMFFTRNIVTHHLSHTFLSHTIFHTQF